MSSAGHTFGRRFLATESAGEALELERAEAQGEPFVETDALLGRLVARWLTGERLVTLTRDSNYRSTARLEGLGDEERALVEDRFSVARIEERGTWTLDEYKGIDEKAFETPWVYAEFPRFPESALGTERPRVVFDASPDGVVLWGVLAPLGELLFVPLRLRGPLAGSLERDEFADEWLGLHATLAELGLDVSRQLAPFRWASGWGRLAPEAQVEAKREYLRALARATTPETLARFRLFRLRPAVERYYQKARSDGTALRKTALTKALDAVVTMTFGGDWLAFLGYVGERPHASEKVITAKAKPRVHAAGAARADEVARRLNLPVEEVRRAMGLQWVGTDGASPLELRTATLAAYWEAFDRVHAAQEPGMRPLWGLVAEGSAALDVDDESEEKEEEGWRALRTVGLYEQLLPADVLDAVGRLWGTTVLAKVPERLVTNIDPHVTLAAVFGPALEFWHGVGLTAWFVCEGPYSRTDIDGMEAYYARKLDALEADKAPVDRALFRDLVAAEKTLGRSRPAESSRSDLGGGLSITFNSGAKRSGFEQLRDVVTTHRRAWAAAYLPAYLESQWRSSVEGASVRFGHLLAERGKAPTLKGFVNAEVVGVAEDWFGGNLANLYTAIGETAPIAPIYERRMPDDVKGFARRLLADLRRLGAHRRDDVRYPDGNLAHDPPRFWESKLRDLVGLAVRFVQLEEALGRSPTVKELSAATFTYKGDALATTTDEAWGAFTAAIGRARKDPGL